MWSVVKRKCPSSASEGGDRLGSKLQMKQNFEFLTKEEEECGLLCISDVGEKGTCLK